MSTLIEKTRIQKKGNKKNLITSHHCLQVRKAPSNRGEGAIRV